MKQTRKLAAGVIASLGLVFAAAGVHAQQGPMGGGMQYGQGGMQQGQGRMQHGMNGGMGAGAMGHRAAGQGAGQALMTPEERTAMQEKMRNASTPEERQKLAAANHAEMHKRATEKGITLPEGRGPRFGATPRAPAATE